MNRQQVALLVCDCGWIGLPSQEQINADFTYTCRSPMHPAEASRTEVRPVDFVPKGSEVKAYPARCPFPVPDPDEL